MEDDFENYAAWSTTFGDWTTVDADNGYAGALSEKGTYPHQDEKFAFVNWQPSDVFGAGQGLAPHSGKRAAVSIYQSTKAEQNMLQLTTGLSVRYYLAKSRLFTSG